MPLETEQFNSEQEIRGFLGDALAIVADLNVPEDLREAAFVKAVDLLSVKIPKQSKALSGLDGLKLG